MVSRELDCDVETVPVSCRIRTPNPGPPRGGGGGRRSPAPAGSQAGHHRCAPGHRYDIPAHTVIN